MYCNNCGKETPENSTFCLNCGAKMEQREVKPANEQAQPKSKKKKSGRGTLVVFLMIVAVFVATSVTGLSVTEFIGAVRRGEPLLDRGMYELEDGLKRRKAEIEIRETAWDSDVCSWYDIEYFLQDYLRADPEKYYIDIMNTKMVLTQTKSEQFYTLEMAYFNDLTSERAAERMENAADSFLEQVPAGASDWETALFLHDELIRHVTYEEGPRDQTAYAALVDGKAVCMGYAMAYEYLLTRAGIECDTVMGYSNELSAALSETGFSMPGHAWNIVTFRENGVERSYYVDTTWDDLDLQDIYGRDYISRRWFCATQEDIDKEGRSVQVNGYDMSQWNLNDNTMNYYVYTDSMIDHYDFDEVVQILHAQYLQGENMLTLRLADKDTFYDLSFAMEDNGDLQKLGQILGIGNYTYNYTYGYLEDGLICFNIFLNRFKQ